MKKTNNAETNLVIPFEPGWTIANLGALQEKADAGEAELWDYWEIEGYRKELLFEDGLGLLGEPVPGAEPGTPESCLAHLFKRLAALDDDPTGEESFRDEAVEALYFAIENLDEFKNLGPELEEEDYEKAFEKFGDAEWAF